MALNGWTKKAAITISQTYVTADLANVEIPLSAVAFPALIFDASDGCLAGGGDIRFAYDAAGDQLIDYQLVHLDKATSEIFVYLRLALTASADTQIYVFWGNSSALTPLFDVWQQYYGVVHFQEETVGDQFKLAKDAAGTYNAMTELGKPTHVDAVMPSQKGWQITNGNCVSLTEQIDLLPNFFFEFWINYNGTAPSAGTQNLFAPVDYFSGVGNIGIGIFNGGLVVRDTSIGGAAWPNWSDWHHVAFFDDGGTCRYYLDGQLHSSGTLGDYPEKLSWLSGAGQAQFVQYPAVGYSISALKFGRNSQPADAINVIKTRYNAFKHYASFATAGAVETVSQLSSLTLTGIQPNSEVRIFNDATGDELAGVETSTDTFTYNYEYSSDIAVVIVVHANEFEHLRIPTTLTAQSNTIPVQQRRDRVYKNPD